MSDEVKRPRENPGRPLTPKTVVWCHVPREENGVLIPGRIKTPVIVAAVNRGPEGIRSISAVYTSIAAGREFDDPLVFVIRDDQQKKHMGVDEYDRAAHLRRAKVIPFEERFFGETPEISGRVTERLWEAFCNRAREIQQERVSKIRGSSVTSWSNLPPDEYARRPGL